MPAAPRRGSRVRRRSGGSRAWQGSGAERTLIVGQVTQTAHFPPGNYAILFPLPLMVVLANGGITLGFTAYWLSLRQFYNDPPLRLMVLPAITGMLVLLWYSTVTPHTAYRVAISSVVWTIIFGGCLHTLLKQGHRDSGHGRQVLIAVFALLLAFVWIRMGYLTLVAR